MGDNLGQVLKLNRNKMKYSLRQAEKITGISNAYLSQLERNIATSPSPSILQQLAKCYDYPYEKLMRLAGYLQNNKKPPNDTIEALREAEIALMSSGLNSNEVEKVMEYVSFVKKNKQ